MKVDEVARDGRWVGVKNDRCRAMSLGTVALVLCMVACKHAAYWALQEPTANAASVENQLASASYNRFVDNPSACGRCPGADRADLTAIAGQARRCVRQASTQAWACSLIAAELGSRSRGA
jgi:hypothetical protein